MSQSWSRLWPYSASLLAIAAALAAAVVIDRGNLQGLAMLMLVPVMWSAVRFGRTISIFTAVAGSATINLFVMRPSLELAELDRALALLTYLLVAIVTSGLVSVAREEADRHREQAHLARRRSEDLSTLYEVAQALGGASDLADLKGRVERAVAELMGVSVRLDLTEQTGICPPGCCLPVADVQGPLGCLTVDSPSLDDDRRRLLTAVAAQVAIAVRRARLAEEMSEARILANTEKLRAALLSSVSHDFRTPLGTIIGAATSLLGDEAAYDQDQRHTLLNGVLLAARRLDRFTRNLLDITCIESGAVAPRRDWVELGDVLGTALGAADAILTNRTVRIDLPPDLPLLNVDFVLIEHVLLNLIENAVKYSPPDSAIGIDARQVDDTVVLDLFNLCDTVPADHQMSRLFDKFYRGTVGAEGSGLGLSICRGFMAAHGGSITARRDEPRGGIVFSLSFPVEAHQPMPELMCDE